MDGQDYITYIGVGIVTTLIIPDTTFPNGAGQLNNSPVDGWLGAPTTYVNTGIITNLTATTANVDKVNADVVNTLKIRGNDDIDNPTGEGYLWMLNGQFSSKLWLSGTADEEGLRANVGVITYFGPGAKGVLGVARPAVCRYMLDLRVKFVVNSYNQQLQLELHHLQ